ncbi:DUF1707 SHOCT-like domain-containing protein [Actinomadura rayongensis]|uniref:DUF1707 domain-containing protein n=1 Tax=Actinomadura rayongensis TaxID=1429076 RepID=A0A6I4W9C0_9ACTN|nr:DUF1707 domain-containing protein [Actinomadura rayongensis]MXQ63332.1 DUF1707 domain-containing protein [Actinomadura rayongensis]
MSLDTPADPRARASDGDRDAVLVRLHTAFAEGRLDERELDERIERTLASRTHGELSVVSADLPAAPAQASGPSPSAGRGARLHLAYKGALSRTGRWTLPERATVVVYKGSGVLDLTSAEFAGALTRLRVIAYKSGVELIVPPGVRVEAGGVGVSSDVRGAVRDGAPVLRVKGLGYKGSITVKDHAARA